MNFIRQSMAGANGCLCESEWLRPFFYAVIDAYRSLEFNESDL